MKKSDDPIPRYLGKLQAEVMGIFWARTDATVREVLDELNRRRKRRRREPFAYTTVLTLVTRLHSRRLLSRNQEGRGYRYVATGSRAEFLAQLSADIIDRLLDDFGEIAIAQLLDRLDGIHPPPARG